MSGGADDRKGIADRFVERARRALLDGSRLEFDPGALLLVLRDPEARAHLLRLLQTNSPDLKRTAIGFFRRSANQIEADAAATGLNVEPLDRAGLAPAAGLLVGGVGLFTNLGWALGPLGMFCGGLIGLMLCGIGRHRAGRLALDLRGRAVKMREFMDDLRD